MNPLGKDSLAPLLERLRLYNQAQRLAILGCLLKGRYSVSEIEHLTGIVQPALSQQLGELRRAGIIGARRESREVHYDFASDEERDRTRVIFGLLTHHHGSNPAQNVTQPQIGAQFAAILDD